MKSFFLIALALLVAGCTDRGRCLESHPEQQWFQPPPIMIPNGNNGFTYIPQAGYWITVTVCDSWEFPDGRPKQ